MATAIDNTKALPLKVYWPEWFLSCVEHAPSMMNTNGDGGPVLVVDDDQPIRAVVTWVLEDEGYRVDSAVHGRSALEAIAHEAPRAILLDMRMPVMDGWAFVSAYRSMPGPHAPIIVMIASQTTDEWGADVQANGCLHKPFEMTELLEAVEALSGRAV